MAARQEVRPQPDNDGAAPLIGSTLVMQRLRETIERVASSDFTVVIEGPIQRQWQSRSQSERVRPNKEHVDVKVI